MFDIPPKWRWSRLSDLAIFGGGKTPSTARREYWDNGSYLWVTSKDMKCDCINDSILKLTDEGIRDMEIYPPQTILMVVRSGILRRTLPVAILERHATINQDLKAISLYNNLNPWYLLFYFKALEKDILEYYQKDGTTVESIDFEKLKEVPIAIPPYPEQKRIVDSIEQWFVVIDKIEQEKKDLENAINQTKSKILDLAIHGKLVPQAPNDEPAIELLRRINPDSQPCDNAHYIMLPDGWSWCLLEDVANVLDSKRQPIKTEERKKRIQGKSITYPYYGATGIAGDTDDYIMEGRYILLGEDGAPFLDKNAPKAYEVTGRFWVNNHAHILEPQIDFLFLLHFLNAVDYAGYVKGTTRLKLTQSDMNRIKIMLPPLSEQQLIVAKIEELFATLDKIKESLEV